MNIETTDYRWVKEPRWLFGLGEWTIKFWYDLTPEQKDDIKYLHRASATLHRIAENDCNGHPRPVIEYREGKRYEYSVEDENWTARDEKTEVTLRKKIQAIADKHGWKVEFQGDPRGAVVKLEIDGRDMTDLICA